MLRFLDKRQLDSGMDESRKLFPMVASQDKCTIASLRFDPIKLLDILLENNAIDDFDYEEFMIKVPGDVDLI